MGFSFRSFALGALCLLASAIAWSAPAKAAGERPPCFVQFDRSIDAAELLGESRNWHCRGEPSAGRHGVALRFDLASSASPPRFLYTQLGDFERLTLYARTRSGKWSARSFTLAETLATTTGPFFLAPLPHTDQPIDRLIARFDAPGHAQTLLFARPVSSDPSTAAAARRSLILLAVLFGAMLIPVLFDLIFYRTIKEKFIIWHSALAASFAGLVALRSGLVHTFLPMDPQTWRIAMIAGFGVAIAAAAMFTRQFIEPGKLHPLLHRLLVPAALWALCISAVHALSLPVLRPLGGNFHSLGLLPVLLLFLMTIMDAYRRGSRAVRFQVLGWSPLIFAFCIQIVTQLISLGQAMDALPIFYFGVLCETLATAIGVADRFLIMRDARDKFAEQARRLDGLAQRDPLTGLLNRRAVEPHFAKLRADGFDTFAVLDLDRFKSINDHHGHRKGDEVLTAAARAIVGDGDVMTVRLGGEEFLLLLRGPHARERAEQLRQQIPMRVASEVEGLKMPITASMGLIEVPRDAFFDMAFDAFYRHADRLLYEAKSNGRNRTMCERLTPFGSAPRERKAAAKSAA